MGIKWGDLRTLHFLLNFLKKPNTAQKKMSINTKMEKDKRGKSPVSYLFFFFFFGRISEVCVARVMATIDSPDQT